MLSTPLRSLASSRLARRALAPTVALATLAATLGPSLASPPPAQANPLVDALAGAIVKGGASYLTAELRKGALGERGKFVGDILTQAGLYNDTPDQLAELRDQLGVVNTRIDQLGTQLNGVDGHVLQGNYSVAAQVAAQLIGNIQQAWTDLMAVTREPTPEKRAEAAKRWEQYYFTKLHGESNTLNLKLTNPAPGADGLIVLASKASRGNAQPFFTPELAEIPFDVYRYYSLYEAELTTMKVNYLQYHDADQATILAAIDEANRQLNAQWGFEPTKTLFYHEVIDTRTDLLWTYEQDYTPLVSPCPVVGRVQKCTFDYSKIGQVNWFNANTPGSRIPASISYGGGAGWSLPTADQLRSLIKDKSGATGAWLSSTTGGNLPNYSGLVWANPGNATASTGSTFNLADGGTGSRPAGDKLGQLYVAPAHSDVFRYWSR